MDKQTARRLSAALQEAATEVAARFGLEAKVGGGSFDAATFKPRVEFREGNADEVNFRRYATEYGLQADDFGREFVSHGRRFRITGLNPRAQSYPVIAVSLDDGKSYKFTSWAALR